MAIVRLKGNTPSDRNIYYEFDKDSEPLGEGGMGKVYCGRQVSELTGQCRDVAIKFMFAGLPQEVIDRARREASIQIISENLVEMMGFIETTSEGPNHSVRHHYHVVSELLSGVMLADLLNGITTSKDGRQIAFAQRLYQMYQDDRVSFALFIMKNVASGIMKLHDKGYIHRDIDPTNIMLTEDEKIKLIDFGIAKKLPNHNSTSSDRLTTQDRALTSTGQFVGKVQYASPELVVGDIQYQNETTDIYAMGILFYQLLVGKLPFTGPVTKVMEAQKSTKTPVKNIVGIQDVDDVRYIVAKATEKEQNKRYQTAAEFRADLDAVGKGIGRKKWKYYLASVLGLLILALAYLFVFRQPFHTEELSISQRLMNKEMAKDAWNELLQKNDASSLFLQSQILQNDYLPDSIIAMKKNLIGISTSNPTKAHNLLEQAYSLAPDDARILYNMGLDLYFGERRGYGVGENSRNLDDAQKYFSQALVLARKSENDVLIDKIERMLETW